MRKLFTLSLLLACSLCAFAEETTDTLGVDSTATNLVINGNFEDSTDVAWTLSNSDILTFELTYPTIDSTYYCRMPGKSGARTMSQDIEVEAGATYQFSMTGRIQNAHASVSENNHSTKGAATLLASLVAGTTDLTAVEFTTATYTTKDATVVIPSGETTLKITISKEWNIAYVDDVILTKTSDAAASLPVAEAVEVSVFPNPVSSNGNLYVKSAEQFKSFQLVNLYGQQVMSGHIVDQNTPISVTGLSQGCYLLNLKSASGTMVTETVVIAD